MTAVQGESRRLATLAMLRQAGRVLAVLVTGLLIALLAAVTVAAPALHLGLSTVLTGSMSPAFAPGDLLITAPRDVATLAPGQIAVFTPPGETAPYAHRITGITGDPARPVLTTKGDANSAPDSWRAQLTDQTTPVVIATVPLAGHALAWAQDPPVRAGVTGLLGLTLTVVGIRRILRPSRNPSSRRGRRASRQLPAH